MPRASFVARSVPYARHQPPAAPCVFRSNVLYCLRRRPPTIPSSPAHYLFLPIPFHQPASAANLATTSASLTMDFSTRKLNSCLFSPSRRNKHHTQLKNRPNRPNSPPLSALCELCVLCGEISCSGHCMIPILPAHWYSMRTGPLCEALRHVAT